MDIKPSTFAKSRHATKAFDANKPLSVAQIAEIETLLRFSPSAVNSQPWHFVLASTTAGKQKLSVATSGSNIYNQVKVLNAGLVVVFCTRASIDESYMDMLLAQEEKDGRIPNAEAKAKQIMVRNLFVNEHRFGKCDVHHWMEKQVFLALGTLLLGAEMMGLQACPMEGFDQKIMDEILDLNVKGYTSAVMVALGYRSDEDFNGNLPKSRLPADSIFTRI